MITSVTVLSYERMLERARDHGIPSNACVVSIVNPEQEAIFMADTDRIITVRFHDLDPAFPVNTDLDPASVLMTEDHARKIVGHVLTFHEHPERWEFLCNCMAGISRSGAVGTFVQQVAGIPDAAFLTQTELRPNRYVRRLLVQEWSRRREVEPA